MAFSSRYIDEKEAHKHFNDEENERVMRKLGQCHGLGLHNHS